MAQKLEYKIVVDDKGAISSIEGLNNELQVTNQQIDQINKDAPGAFNDLGKSAKTAGNSLVTAEDKVKGFKGGIDIAAGAIAGLTGAVGLMGIQNEEFEKFTAYAVNAIALSEGIKTTADGAIALGEYMKTAGISMNLFGNATKGGSVALSGFKKALIATGIGALVVALGTAIAYWDDIAKAIGLATEEEEIFAEINEEVISQQADLGAKITQMTTTLDLARQGFIDKDKALQDYNDEFGDTIGYADDLNQAEELLSANSAVILKQIKLRAQAQALYAKAAEQAAKAASGEGVEPSFWQTVGDALLSGGNSFAFAANQAKTFAKNTMESADEINNLNTQADELYLQAEKLNAELKKGAPTPKEREERKAANDERLAQLNALKEKAKELADERELLGKSEIEQAKIVAKRTFDARIEGFEEGSQAYKDAKALFDAEIKAIDDEAEFNAQERRAQLNEILQTYEIDSIENQFEKARQELAIQEQLALDELTLLGATEAQKQQIRDAYGQKRKNLDKEVADYNEALQEQQWNAVLSVASGAFGAIQQLAGENSAVGKVAAIAQTVIDTYASATAAYKSVVGIPVVGPVLAPIAAGTAVAAGIANLAAIKKTKVPGEGGAASGASISRTSAPAPNLPTAPPTGVSPETQFNQTPVQAYVVSGDVTSSQEAQAKLNTRRTLEPTG